MRTVRRARRPLVALLALVGALAVGYGVQACSSSANSSGRTPDRSHEYTVPTPGSPDRGARRIVTGRRGEFWYTGDLRAGRPDEMTLTDAIQAIYRQVGAPEWAAANLDGLADVLRDLSWLPPGPVPVAVPQLPESEATQLRAVLWQVAGETADGLRPIQPSE